jgi:hypothetical protein
MTVPNGQSGAYTYRNDSYSLVAQAVECNVKCSYKEHLFGSSPVRHVFFNLSVYFLCMLCLHK